MEDRDGLVESSNERASRCTRLQGISLHWTGRPSQRQYHWRGFVGSNVSVLLVDGFTRLLSRFYSTSVVNTILINKARWDLASVRLDT